MQYPTKDRVNFRSSSVFSSGKHYYSIVIIIVVVVMTAPPVRINTVRTRTLLDRRDEDKVDEALAAKIIFRRL